jgi:hypothetical protein
MRECVLRQGELAYKQQKIAEKLRYQGLLYEEGVEMVRPISYCRD